MMPSSSFRLTVKSSGPLFLFESISLCICRSKVTPFSQFATFQLQKSHGNTTHYINLEKWHTYKLTEYYSLH